MENGIFVSLPCWLDGGFFETLSPYIFQTNLKLAGLLFPQSPSAQIMGICHLVQSTVILEDSMAVSSKLNLEFVI